MQLIFPLRSAFLALPLEGEATRRFRMMQDRLQLFEEILCFQNPASPHLTLIFWKELMEIEYQPIVKKAREIAARSIPFTLEVLGAGTFGARGNDRALFLTVAFSPELATLKKLCPWSSESDNVNETESERTGLVGPVSEESLKGKRDRERKPSRFSFTPHITLARVRHPQQFATVKKKVMKELDGISFPIAVDRLRLYAEVEGRQQTVVEEFVFG